MCLVLSKSPFQKGRSSHWQCNQADCCIWASAATHSTDISASSVGVSQHGSTWLSMAQHGSAWLSMAQDASACLNMAQHGSAAAHSTYTSAYIGHALQPDTSVGNILNTAQHALLQVAELNSSRLQRHIQAELLIGLVVSFNVCVVLQISPTHSGV